MKLEGIARIQLNVANYAACVTFYAALVRCLGGKTVAETPALTYWVIGPLALVVSRAADKRRLLRKRDDHPGLDHVCYRVRARADVTRIHELAEELGAKVIHLPGTLPWSPGSYSVTFADPDGNRIEVSHIPRKGHLDETVTIPMPHASAGRAGP